MEKVGYDKILTHITSPGYCKLIPQSSFLCGFMQDIVIGTPGRLKDLIEMGVCRLNEVSFVVSIYYCLVINY